MKTPSQTVGPYYSIGLSRGPQNELADPNDPAAVRLHGTLLDGQGDGDLGRDGRGLGSGRRSAGAEAAPTPRAASRSC